MSATQTAPASATSQILDAIKAQSTRMDNLSKDVTDLKQKAMTATTPNITLGTSGPIGQDSRGYSILKAAAFCMGFLNKEECKEELNVHERLKKLYSERGRPARDWHYGSAAFLMPFSTDHIPQDGSDGVELSRDLRVKMLASVQGYDPQEREWLYRKKALGTISDAAGGVLIGFPTLGELIDLQRNMEVFTRAGASEMSLPANARISLPKLTGGSTAYWVGEAVAITESQQTTGNLNLEGKKLGVLTKLNNELLRYTSPTTEGMVRNDMARQSALVADLAMLTGTGGTQIKGLLTYESQTSWTQGTDKIILHTASTTGASGDTFQPEDIYLMKSKLPDPVQEQDPKSWIMRNNMWGVIANRRADAVAAGDGKGPFLFNLLRDNAGQPTNVLDGDKVVKSSQVSNTRDKGAASNLTYILYGFFPDWVIGRFGVMEFLATNLGDTAFQNDQTWLRGIQILDAGARHAASFIYADDLVIA